MPLVTHLEKYLGEIDTGWKDDSAKLDLQVASFKNQPFKGARTYCTLGLSNLELPMVNGTIRQELIFSAYERFDHAKIASFLSTFAETIASEDRALLHGDIVGPSSPIILGTLLDTVYISLPMVYSQGLAVDRESVPPTVFAWVVPIHADEANFARQYGWKKLDLVFEEKNPDVWDLHRPSAFHSVHLH